MPFSKKKKPGHSRMMIEYEPENVHDSVLDEMIKHAYEMFRLVDFPI